MVTFGVTEMIMAFLAYDTTNLITKGVTKVALKVPRQFVLCENSNLLVLVNGSV
jgi:hypothetical protein